MEWTKGIVAILLCAAIFISPTHCLQIASFSVGNLNTQDVTSWGFRVVWTEPAGGVAEYNVELWSGSILVETQVKDNTTTGILYEGLPDNTGFTVVVWSVKLYGANNQYKTYSLPQSTDVTTLDTTLVQDSRTDDSIVITIPPPTSPPTSYHIEYKDVASGTVSSLTRSVITGGTQITLNDLDQIHGSGGFKRGRLVQVTVRENDSSGALVTSLARYRTLLESPTAPQVTLIDSTSVELRTVYGSDYDILEYVLYCLPLGCTSPTVRVSAINNAPVVVSDLTPGGSYEVKTEAYVGEHHRTGSQRNRFRPTWIPAESSRVAFTLVDLICKDGADSTTDPTRLDVSWTTPTGLAQTNFRLTATNVQSGATLSATGNPLSSAAVSGAIPGLEAGTLYKVDLYYTAGGQERILSSKNCYTPLDGVQGLAIEHTTQTSIKVAWNETTTNNVAFHYELKINPEPAIQWRPADGRYKTNATEYTFFGLSPGTAYTISVQTKAEDQSKSWLLQRSQFVNMTATTGTQELSVSSCSDNKRSVTVSWTNTIPSNSTFEVTLETFFNNDKLDGRISPSKAQVLEYDVLKADFKGLEPGIMYKVTLREDPDGGSATVLTSMEFKCDVGIYVTVNELNARYSILNFHPADSIHYDKYVLQASPVAGFASSCQEFANELGSVDIVGCACGIHWAHKPTSCGMEFEVRAYRNESAYQYETAISGPVTLTASDVAPAPYTLYEGPPTADSINVWWVVDMLPSFDYYYLEVTDDANNTVYCTAIPRPQETWISRTIEGLNASACYTVKLEQWLYSEIGDSNNVAQDSMDATKQFYTALGNAGEVSSLYVLDQIDDNLRLAWGEPAAVNVSGYQVCIEPVENPAAFNPITLTDRSTTLQNVADKDFTSVYNIEVSTFLEATDKQRQYSIARCDPVDLDAPFRGELTVQDARTTELDIQWLKDQGFLPVTSNYRINVTEKDGPPVGNPIDYTSSADTLQRTLTNLIPGTEYCIRVQWLNIEHDLFREVCNRTCPRQPGTITPLDNGLTTIAIEWDEATGNGNKDFYLIYATDLDNNGNRTRKGRVGSSNRTFVVEGLVPDTTYRIEVVAVSGTEADNKPSVAREIVEDTRAISPCDIVITGIDKDWIQVRWGPCPEADTLQICPPPNQGNITANLTITDRNTGDKRLYVFQDLRASKKYSLVLKDGGKIIDSTTKYTEPNQPDLKVESRTPTSVTVSASTDEDFPDARHTIRYQLFGPDGELLGTKITNGQDAFDKWTWRELTPNTKYICRATIVAGYAPELKTSSDPLEDGIMCTTPVPQRNKIYLERNDENSITLLWGDLGATNVRYQIEIDPPPQSANRPYRIDIFADGRRQIGGLSPGQRYEVHLLEGSGVSGVQPVTRDSLVVFTEPSSDNRFQIEVVSVDQTSVNIRWQWSRDEVIDHFAIDHTPVIGPRTTPDLVPFWYRDFSLGCLLPGQQVSVSLSSVIQHGGYFTSSTPSSQQVLLPRISTSVFEIICVCYADDSFTVAWSNWLVPTGFDFDGYDLNLYSLDNGILNNADLVKVPPSDRELFHHFYNLGDDEFDDTPYVIKPTSFYIVDVWIRGTNTISQISSDTRASKLILTRPKPPANLTKVQLPDPEGKISLKVKWDAPEDSYVDYYIVYYNRFGSPVVREDKVDPKTQPLEYLITGLDPQDPSKTVDLDNPNASPAAYSVRVVAVYNGTFTPPTAGGTTTLPPSIRKKRQVPVLQEMSMVVLSEPSVLPYRDGLTDPIDPQEILAQKVNSTSILALFGADPAKAKPDGKYRYFVDAAEDVIPPFEARGGTTDVPDADYYFQNEFNNLVPGTVFSITLSTELAQPQNGQTDARNSIQVLTNPEPPSAITLSQGDSVSATFTWPKPDGLFTYFEVTFERPNLAPEMKTTEDREISFDNLLPETEYTITVWTVRVWERIDGTNETKKSDPVSLTITTLDLRALEIAIQDFGDDFINIVFGKTLQDVVYEVSIDPGNCPCGWIENGDYCYYVGNTARVDYYKAEFRCTEQGAELVSILSQDEQDFIAESTENDPDTNDFGFWLGLNDVNSESNFVYPNGSAIGFSNWATGEPNDGGASANEDCVTMWQTTSQMDKWADVRCSEEQAYICKKQKVTPGVKYPVQPSATTAHNFTSLVPGECYTITVDADLHNPRTETQRTKPLPVTNITTDETSPVTAQLSWTNPRGVVDGFAVSYVRKDSGADPTDLPHKLLKPTTKINLNDLEPDTSYILYVKTVASFGECDEQVSEAAEFEFRTLVLQPGIAYIKDVTLDSITVTWGAPTNTFSLVGYQLYLCTVICNDALIFGTTKTEHTFTDLVPGQEYSIRFQVRRTGTSHDPEQLLVRRTVPISVPLDSFKAEASTDSIKFSWDAPVNGKDHQYELWYSVDNCLKTWGVNSKQVLLNSSATEYEVRVDRPNTVVFASIQVYSKLECDGVRSLPAIINGVKTAALRPLEIFVNKRGTSFLEITWGGAEGDAVEYSLSWFKEADQSDIKQRSTKYKQWLIQGLIPGESYYINVKYSNLESPNKGWFPTAINTPSGLQIRNVTATKAVADWNEDTSMLTDQFAVFYNSEFPQKCAPEEPIIRRKNETEVELKYLNPSTNYTVRVYGRDGDIHSAEPAVDGFSTDSIPFGECQVVGVNATSIVAVWDSVIDPLPVALPDTRYDVYMYRHSVKLNSTDEVHGEQAFRPSDRPYVKFENLWSGRQYKVCCSVRQINVATPVENCFEQVTAPQPPRSLAVRDENLTGFCVYWDKPNTNFDNFVIKVTDKGKVVYPPAGVATVPANNSVYETLSKDDTFKCIDGLLPGVTYNVTLGTWVDGAPEPQISETLTRELTTDKLEPLELLLEEQEKDSLKVQWGAMEDPNVPNPEYNLKWYEKGTTNEVPVATHNLAYEITSLEAGKGYYIEVKYKDQKSPNSGIFYTVPCPPENLTTLNNTDFPISGTRFSLTWGSPSQGGYEGYRISYVDPDGDPNTQIEAGVVDKNTENYTVVGLYVDQQYTFSVQTIVGFDRRPNDTRSAPVTHMGKTLPLGPLEIEISKRDTNSFQVGWGAITNPAADETRYVITAETAEGGSVAAIDNVPLGGRTISELGPVNSGIKYNIQVVIGQRKSAVICLYSIPESPGDIFLIQATSSTLDVGWAPAQNFVGEYEIVYSPVSAGSDPIRKSPTDRRLELENLNPGTEYEFTIVNTVGKDNNTKTDSEPVIAKFTTRSAVLSVIDSVTTNTIKVQWTPETGDFDHYLLRVVDTDHLGSQDITRNTAPTNTEIQDITNLLPGVRYRLELYTVKDGREQLSDIEEDITDPAPPENLQLTSSTFSALNVEWDQPSLGRWDGYEVMYDYSTANPNNTAVGRTPSPSDIVQTTIALEGLLPSSEFEVTVRAFRRFGNRTIYSTHIQDDYMTLAAPEGSLIVRNVTETTVTVYWTSKSGAVDGYNIHLINVNTNEVKTFPNPFFGNDALLEDLVSGAVYDIQLTSININGGDSQRQATIPKPVTALTRIQRSIDSITLGWDGLDGGINGEATGFIVRYYPRPADAPAYQQVPNVPNGEVLFTLDNLLTDQLYEFNIVTYSEFTGRDNIVRREQSDEFKHSVTTYDLNPGQVQILNVEKERVCFKWGGTDSGAATGYELRLVEVGNATAQPRTRNVNINAAALESCFDDLEPGTLYDLAVNVGGTLESGTEQFRTTVSRPPNLRDLISYQCSITIAWNPADGHADAYRVYYRKTDPPGAQLVHADDIFPSERLQFTLENLDPATEYEFQVRTVAGSEQSDAAIVLVNTDIETLVVEQIANAISISWPPVDSSFTRYELHHSPENGDQPSSVFLRRTDQRLVRLSGLTAGQQYTLVLNILTEEGERTLIARTCFTLKPPAIPVQSVTVTPQPNEAQTAVLRFNSPVVRNAMIGSLLIRATPAATGAGTGNPVELEFIIPFEACPEIRLTGLCPETFYVITIYTMSGQTLSDPVTTSFTTPSASQGQISFGKYTPTSIEVFWADGILTDYRVRISFQTAVGTAQTKEQVNIANTAARTYIFRNLTPGTLYTVTVSTPGSGTFLDRKSIRTRPIALFGDLLATFVGHDKITLTWPAAGGIDGYQVCYYDVDDQVSRTYDVHVAYTESTVEALLPETAYVFSIASFVGDDAGRSTSQKLTLITETDTDPAVPPPRNVIVSSSDAHTATVRWDAPYRDDYDFFLVEYLPDGTGHPDSPVLVPRDEFSLDVYNLVSDTDYVFTVTALRGRGGLDEVASVPVTKAIKTDSVPFLIETLEVSDTTIEVTWGPHTSAALSYYEVTYDSLDGFVADPVVSHNELRVATLQSLRPDTSYEVRVQAKNGAGDVLNVATATVKTFKLPVRSFRAIDETTNSIFIYWPPAVNYLPTGQQIINEDVARYRVYVQSYTDYRGPGKLVYSTYAPQSACPRTTLRNLEAGHKYLLHVVAVDANDNPITAYASIVADTLPHSYLDLYTVAVDTDSIEVAWTAPNGEFANYLLQYNPPGLTSPFQIFSKSDERKFELQGLQPGQSYAIKLTVQTLDNRELFSTTLRQFTTPVAPRELVFSRITDTGFNVAWPTVFTGRSDYYGLCVFPDPKDINLVDVYPTNYDLQGLAPSTNHLVSVCTSVKDEDGNVVWSEPISDYQETTVGEPGVPIVVDFGETTVKISWVRVEGVTRYYVRRTQLDGSDLATDIVQAPLGLTVEYTFEGLEQGEEYFFYVRPDVAQFLEEYTKQRTKPLPPLFVRSEVDTENPTERTIVWQPPGLGRVDRYELTYSPGNGLPPPPIYINADQPLRQTITGLNPNLGYVFIVTSEAGIEATQIRTRSEPAVADVDVVIRLAVENYGHYAIDVAWPELPGDFDSYVISYEPFEEFKPNVRPSPVELGREYGITSLNIYGLVPGQEYTIFLRTKTGQTVSPIIQQVKQTTKPLPVDDIRIDLVTASSFHFSWNDAEGIKERYQVFFKPVADVNNPAPALGSLPEETFYLATGGPTTVQVTDLEPAQEYEITVVTWSGDQRSYGTTVVAATRPFPPSFVEILSTTTSSAEVQWYDGEVGNLGISKYQIEVIPRDNTRTAVIEADSGRNTHLITGLTAGRPYQALVQSIVVDRNGEYLDSLPVSVAFVTIPLSPIFDDPEITSNAITIRWESGGGDLTSYIVEYYPVPDNPSVLSPITVPPRAHLGLTISGLSSSTEHTFNIKAVTSVTVEDSQTGTFDVIKESATNTVFYTTLPNHVPSFYVTSTTPTSVGLAWSAPEGAVDQYLITVVDEEGRRSDPIPINPNGPLEYVARGLQPDSDYSFEIVNAVGTRRSSPISASASTNEDISGPPSDLRAEVLNPNSILVQWQAPENVNGDLQGYVLVVSKRSLADPSAISTDRPIDLQENVLNYIFDELEVGYEYSFTVTAVNNIGHGVPQPLGAYVRLPETAPPPTNQVPYRTPDSNGNRAYTLSITFRRDFFRDIYGAVANYSVLVAEEPDPREDITRTSLSEVSDPPPTYQTIHGLLIWPGYQASPSDYNPFDQRLVKRQIGGDQNPAQVLQTEFVIGTEEDCPGPQDPRYCNGRLKPYTYYRIAIRAYGGDGTYTDTPWSDPISTGFNVLWFVYALVGLFGFVVVCFFIILCVCCRACGTPGETDFFEDSEEDKMMMMKQMSMGTPPPEPKHHHQPEYYYRPPAQKAPSEKSHPAPPRHHPAPPRNNPPAHAHNEPARPVKSNRPRCYAPASSQWSKPIFVNQFGEHMRLMSANGGMRFTEELNKLNDIGANMPSNAATNAPEKNRYRNILPYDSNRVVLHDPPDGLDYINASYVDGHHGNNEYIVTQGPLPNTIEDFWEMIWENEIPTIIMNTNCVENGRVKCEKYWPDSGEMQYGRMTVKLISESDTQDWTVRTFELSKDGESKGHVRLFQYRNWPDQGAPRDPRSVLKFLQTVRAQHPRRTGPGIVVHCSAGVGRSGTFVAIDRLVQHLISGHGDTIDVYGMCAKLRKQRRYMVQSEEQYKFVHRSVHVFLQQQANLDSMLDGGTNWAMGSSGNSAGPTAYANDGMSLDGEL